MTSTNASPVDETRKAASDRPLLELEKT